MVAGGRGVGRPAKRGRGRGASTSVSTLSGSSCTRSAHKTPSEDRDMSGELSEPCSPTVHTHMRMHTHTSRHCELYLFDGHRDYSRFSLTRTAGRGRSASTVVSVAVNERGPGGVSSGTGTFLALWRLLSLFCVR